jgi:hypothetical protein
MMNKKEWKPLQRDPISLSIKAIGKPIRERFNFVAYLTPVECKSAASASNLPTSAPMNRAASCAERSMKWPGVIHDQAQKYSTNPERQGKSLKTATSK